MLFARWVGASPFGTGVAEVFAAGMGVPELLAARAAARAFALASTSFSAVGYRFGKTTKFGATVPYGTATVPYGTVTVPILIF